MLTILGLALPTAKAQHVLYPSHFDLHEVVLHDGPFKDAQNLNYKTLLQYDEKRLLTPFIRQAGLGTSGKYANWEAQHPNFENFAWKPQMAMDGHLGGHYLSALAISYASCQDEAVRTQLKQRLDYFVSVLCDCQAAYDKDRSGLKGFIGGIPDNDVWKDLYSGDYRVYNQRGNWVPLYCEHKIMAGLRDAYVYAGSESAKAAFRRLCDWMIDEVRLFKEDVMEMQILQWEPGGVNEVLADASLLFDDSKYFKAAQKFSHQIVIENMIRDERHDFLNQKSVNESAAKFVGFARITELKHDDRYSKATDLFWQDVVTRRSTVIGGTGIVGFFQPANKSTRYISEPDGPDACASYNMLKLTERMFDMGRNAALADYYERTLINHILSNQDTETGGYVYYTSLRPDSYRIYSQPNQAMWCCVGTGMESQSKYGDFIYTMSEDTLFVNLFIGSDLNNADVQLTQETKFPYGNKSRITIKKNGNYVLAVRRPEWTNDKFDVLVNGKAPKGFKPSRPDARSYYVSCGKSWKAGDVIEVTYPMSLSFVECPNVPTYIALKYGPTVLAGVTTKSSVAQPFPAEFAGEKRGENSNKSMQKFQSLALAPMLITERNQVPSRIKVKDASHLIFDVDATASGSPWTHVEMKPFFATHHSKYTVYWNQQTEAAWARNPMYLREIQNIELQKYTYDVVDVGEESDEEAHGMRLSATGSCGALNEQTFRDCQPGQWFEYTFDISQAQLAASDSLAVLLRVSLNDRGRGGFVAVDNTKVGQVVIPSSAKNATKDKFFEYPVVFAADKYVGKKSVTIRFIGPGNASFPRLYNARIIKADTQLLKGMR